jgi:hypothetical protein
VFVCVCVCVCVCDLGLHVARDVDGQLEQRTHLTSALFVSIICQHYLSALFVSIICQHYMAASNNCTVGSVTSVH